MQSLIAFALGLAIGIILLLRDRFRSNSPAAPMIAPGSDTNAPDVEPLSESELSAMESREQLEAELETRLGAQYDRSQHPEDFLQSEIFQQAKRIVGSERFEADELRRWILRDTKWLRVAALGPVLVLDQQKGEDAVIRAMSSFSPWARYAALVELSARHAAPSPWIHELLVRLDRTWLGENELRVLRDCVIRRCAAGEEPPTREAWGAWCDTLDQEQRFLLRDLLTALGSAIVRPWLSLFFGWVYENEIDMGDMLAAQERANASADGSTRPMGREDPLTSCGRLWMPSEIEELKAPVSFRPRDEAADRVLRLLKEPRPRPVVVVGAPRTGKTTLVQAVIRKLLGESWRVLEASPDQINAGMSYVGQLEGRVTSLARTLGPGSQTLWAVPNAADLLRAGSLSGDQSRSIARILRQDLEQRRIQLLGECSRAEWEHARVHSPWISSCFEVVDVPVPSGDETIAMVAEWLEQSTAETRLTVERALLQEAWELTRQFLDENQRPGNLFDTVEWALEDRSREQPGQSEAPLTRGILLRSIARRTGLPLDLLDSQRALDFEAVERFFAQRIRGQDEALGCLLDRLAMIKAGVNDPQRPLGVFLFAGPTGTGKTELAKTLATWLFGSPERLLRVDMSELKDHGALDVLLGDWRHTDGGDALIDRVRREPFSVILLDEFEKAHSEVWDLFLQVFDDGRLSDRQGRVADFRHCMILLTTNLGGKVETRAGVGFASTAVGFRESAVLEALRETFKPELLNRLDRVIVFHPLSREVMREILQRQIEHAIQRRGLRDRPWAMEWDESAIELLLDKGFTEELGARPLQRAIEQHLLVQLARTMATEQAPEGDQFLFVHRAGEELAIDFVDPDAPPSLVAESLEGLAPSARGPAALALDAHGTRSELLELGAVLEKLEARVNTDAWQQAQQSALELTSDPSFWDSSDRINVLDEFETRDRIQRALRSARSLLERLSSSEREQVPLKPLQQLALRVHVLRVAIDDMESSRPREALLVLQAHGGLTATGSTEGARLRVDPECRVFQKRLIEMYRGWARRRGMTIRDVSGLGRGEASRWAVVVQGFGAWSLLQAESGLHVMEIPDAEGRRAQRHAVRVRVIPLEPQDPVKGTVAAIARSRPSEAEETALRNVVRRYREQRSPLVRDAVRGWRTGRLDRVLAGDFDLLAPEASSLESFDEA